MYIKKKLIFSQLIIIVSFFSLFKSTKLIAASIESDTPPNTAFVGVDIQNIDQFKEYIEKNISVASTDFAAEQFVDAILDKTRVLKQNEIGDRIIGNALNEVAEKFRDHDYFSIDRFDGTLNAAQQEIENARLMNNWQKWYPYKLLACFYKKEAITKEDADIIASSMRSDDLDVYNSTTYYDLIYVPGKPFYTNKKEFGIKIYAEFVNKISGFSGFINLLNEDEGETDTI